MCVCVCVSRTRIKPMDCTKQNMTEMLTSSNKPSFWDVYYECINEEGEQSTEEEMCITNCTNEEAGKSTEEEEEEEEQGREAKPSLWDSIKFDIHSRHIMNYNQPDEELSVYFQHSADVGKFSDGNWTTVTSGGGAAAAGMRGAVTPKK